MQKRASLILIILGFALAGASQSPYPNIRITGQSDIGYSYPPCEPSIHVSAKDPARIVAGTILDGFHVSADSGKTWISGQLTSSLGVYGDPCVTGNGKGDFYYCHLGDPAGKGWGSESLLDCIVCQRSEDGGLTWDDGKAAGNNPPRDQDKEWAVCTPDSRHIYMSWTQFDKYESTNPRDSTNILFSRSCRKMNRWKKAVRINQFAGNCLDDDGTAEGAVPASGPQNEVYVAWALNETIWFDRSMNRGKKWLEKDIPAAKIYGGWNQTIPGIMRANGMPVLVSDLSGGQRNGNLYLCWSDTRNGEDNTDIWFSYSSDKGSTWSDPLRVNNDELETHQFFPWMAVDQTNGDLHIVFYHRPKTDGLATDVYLASSSDGGLSWTNERISESPFEPTDKVFFGDYNNISAHGGVVRPIWTRCDAGKLSVWTALVNRQ